MQLQVEYEKMLKTRKKNLFIQYSNKFFINKN